MRRPTSGLIFQKHNTWIITGAAIHINVQLTVQFWALYRVFVKVMCGEDFLNTPNLLKTSLIWISFSFCFGFGRKNPLLGQISKSNTTTHTSGRVYKWSSVQLVECTTGRVYNRSSVQLVKATCTSHHTTLKTDKSP
jgi:hypothetical protein